MSRFDAAIIDLDGTLVDTLGDFEVALNLTFADLGLPGASRHAVSLAIGKGSEHLIRTLLGPAKQHLYIRAWDHYQAHYQNINGQHSDVFEGVIEGLERLLRAQWRLACLTNKPVDFARELLRLKGLERYFQAVFGGDSFERKKPDPLPVRASCQALGTLPERTLMVGDSRNDALAANGAGCEVVLMRYGYNHGEPVESVPALAYLDRLDDLPREWWAN
ncbi:MAG: HAD-IA family hydrolase [Limnohabitans sp.]|nr:HAD-IA family hydrolase [Limnohabitans sp.]